MNPRIGSDTFQYEKKKENVQDFESMHTNFFQEISIYSLYQINLNWHQNQN